MRLRWLVQLLCDHDWYEIVKDDYLWVGKHKEERDKVESILSYKICKSCKKTKFEWGGAILGKNTSSLNDELFARSFVKTEIDEAMKEINKEKDNGESNTTGKKSSVS